MYYLVNIQSTGDSNPVSITPYTDRTEVFSAYHSILASNYASQTLVSFCVEILNFHGGIEIKEFWNRPEV